MYKLCVFDLDGTLVNTIADIAYACNYALALQGYPECEEDSYRYKVGNGMRMICKRALPEEIRENDEILENTIRIYNAYYCEHCCDRSKAYPGIPEMIRALNAAGVKCAVISNKPHPQTMIVMRTLFGENDFAYIEGQSDRFAKKPAPDTLLDCIEKMGVTKEETVYVGDSDVDAIFAHNAGVDCIGVAWGFRGREELEHAEAKIVVDTAQEIVDFVTE